jgi:hypothetical protein
MSDIAPGTRVVHRRYAWVGTVKEVFDSGESFVLWENSLSGRDRCELLTDLRATPVQPTATLSCDGQCHCCSCGKLPHVQPRTSYGSSSTPRSTP